jgi:Protein of unknown function (DUF2905)
MPSFRGHLVLSPHPAIFPCMGPLSEFGKSLVIVGLGIVLVGVLLWSGLGKAWIGRLPGDIHYSKGNVNFYLPLATCLLLSILLSFLLWLFRR